MNSANQKRADLKSSQISWDGRVYAWPPTWTLKECNNDLILIEEPSHISTNYKIASAMPMILSAVTAVGLSKWTSISTVFSITVFLILSLISVVAIVTRWLEVRRTGNIGNNALKVTKNSIYIGKAGKTFLPDWIQTLQCIVDYSDSFYSGPGGNEGVNQVWSEINLIIKDPETATPAQKYPIVGARYDACLPVARKIATAAGWRLDVEGWGNQKSA